MKSAFPLTCSLINEKRMSQLSKSLVVLECAENNKEIRNTDYQQLKKDLGYVIENAFDKGLPSIDYDNVPVYLQDLYWKTIYSVNDLINASKKLKKIEGGDDNEYLQSFKALTEELLPICQKVVLAKAWIVKGRIVKEKNEVDILKEKENRTCPCCFGRFALSKGKMVHHGFQRPGTGYQTESCFGFGYEPFERSNLGTLKIVEYLENILKEKELILPRMKEDKVILLLNEKTRKFFEVKLGDENFEKENNRRILEVERDIKVLKKDITFYNEKLKNWQKTE